MSGTRARAARQPVRANAPLTRPEAGKGMHGDTPGHAFALVSKGKVLWYGDYWLPPDQSMYAEPEKLLADIPTLGR